MKLEFLSKFSDDLDNILDLKIKKKVFKIIEEIESSKKLSEISNIKKLIGFKSAYRIKIDEYRIGFFFENETIELARIIHRKDIYKIFP